MEAKQAEMLHANETIRRLKEKLSEMALAKEELEMVKQLEESKNMEAEERARLEAEIHAKREEVGQMQNQVQDKEEENSALQREMSDARRKHEEATQALVAATTTPSHHHLNDHDQNEDDMVETNGDTSRDLRLDSDDIADPINDRLTLAERNERLQGQLKSLKDELATTRDDTGETTMDRIHKENVKQGRDKYKTLREVRKGNTKRRVDQFENM